MTDTINTASTASNSAIKVLNHEMFGQVRLYTDDFSKQWFCARDVALALGYADTKKAIKAHCSDTGVIKHPLVVKSGISANNEYWEQTAELTFIDVGNLCRLICSSKLPTAQKFERWVFDEVLPSILKHGVYITEEVMNQWLISPEMVIETIRILQKEREEKNQLQNKLHVVTEQLQSVQGQIQNITSQLDNAIAIANTNYNAYETLNKQYDEYKHNACHAINTLKTTINEQNEELDKFVENNAWYKMSDAAKQINIKGWGRNKIFKLLREKKVVDIHNTAFQTYCTRGYFKVHNTNKNGYNFPTTLVSSKGVSYIMKLIKSYKPEPAQIVLFDKEDVKE